MIRFVIGLGNPGEKYERTRHNVGFMVIDEVAKHLRVRKFFERYLSHVYKVRLGAREVLLIKPQTFMNNSGRVLENLAMEYEFEPDNILVIYDDLDLPLGTVRLRPKGGSGGHKGMESIISVLKSENFPRLRIGIGRPKDKRNVVSYVLSPFTKEEEATLYRVVKKAKECVIRSIELSLEESMEFCNRKDI
jgi:PTH1 family peptidyl-tRNA hydrolase